jgi:L-rhamnose mutarotase
MQKSHYSIYIDAPKEKVWDTMLNDATYRQWTVPFSAGSYYEGDWQEGSTIKFLSSEMEGGMYSRIKESRLHEFVSIEHLGLINADGEIDTTSEEVKKWTPAFENYTFTEKDGGTEVTVDLDTADEYKEMFDDMWPKALQLLKELSEK